MKVSEIVRQSGVSRSTVFRFLRGENVRAGAKKAIIAAMEELGCVNEFAVNKQMRLELEISASHDLEQFSGFARVVDGVMSAAHERGVQVSIMRRDAEKSGQDYPAWDHGKLGVIVIGKNLVDEVREEELLLAHQIPHVFINRIMDQPKTSFVAVDLADAACEITRHLIRRGCRRIAVSGDVTHLRVDRDKIAGYKRALCEAGLPVDPRLCLEDVPKAQLTRRLTALLEGGLVPDAYLGLCDTHAMQFIRLAEHFGLRVPEDIAVAGMDDVPTGEMFRPSLTTVHIPFYEMGALAVDALLKQTHQDVRSVRTVLKHHLVLRESC
ncbi:MAG: LacI family DNA-binding transcriptional regulator [Clostridia bacterium]